MIDPWVGSRWGDNRNIYSGKKLLIVGESAHSAENPVGSSPASLLTDTVETFISSRPNWRFHRILTTLLAGRSSWREVSEDDCINVWQSVAFRNFVPVVAANYARDPIPADYVRLGGEAHRLFVANYQPQAVLVCGFNAWGWFNQQLNPTVAKPWETERMTVIEGIPCACIKHPSTGFTYNKWAPALSYLLDN